MPFPNRQFWSPWRLLGISIATLAIFAVAFLGWQYWLFHGGVFLTSKYDPSEWKALANGTSDFSCYRGGMAGDIRSRVLHTGMSKTEVEALIGPPDSTRDGVLEYFLGMCSGLRIDFDTLDVHLDADGKVKNVLIVQH